MHGRIRLDRVREPVNKRVTHCEGTQAWRRALQIWLSRGDTVVVGNNGIWGARVVDMAGRFGGDLASAWLHQYMSHVYSA